MFSIGQTALHFAIEYDNTLCAKILLDAGANVNAMDDNALTPIELAVSKEICGPIRILVEKKASMDFVNIGNKDMEFVNECSKKN